MEYAQYKLISYYYNYNYNYTKGSVRSLTELQLAYIMFICN